MSSHREQSAAQKPAVQFSYYDINL